MVRATGHRSHDDPEIRFVVRRSGHRTLRIVFAEYIPTEVQRTMLRELKPIGVGYEGASWGFYALDLTPEGDLAAVCRRLEEWCDLGMLDCYETGEALQAGSFDLPARTRRRRRPRRSVGSSDQPDPAQ